jgi:CubicO group peptidase (beta-lactamase class C family)
VTADTTALSSGVVRDLERRVRAAQRDWRSPAVSAGVVRDGRLVWSAHVGSARLEGATTPGDDTQYMIGSITKTFTAVLVMALRDEGKLGLDDRLDDHLPGTRHGAVTIRQMLAHASGLQREPVGRIWENLEAPDQERLLRELEDAERVLPPHFVFHYSNLAYALLGQIVERLEKRSWEETVTERILAPLEMRHTGVAPDEDARALGYLVHPHAGTVTLEPRFDLRATTAFGGLWSTVADLGRYASFVADPVAEVLSPDTVEEMCRPVIMTDVDGWGRAYGLGFDLQRVGERVLAGHGGAMPGYLAGLRVRRADGVGVVVFSNSSAGAQPVALAAELVTAVLDAEPALAQPWAPSQPQAALAGMLGSWWSEGEEIVFEVRDDQLWARLPGAGTLGETRFEQESADRFRAVQGRERGELLEVARDDDGSVRQMYLATYAVTRTPQAFADLAEAADEAPARAQPPA